MPKKFGADWLFTISDKPIKNGVVSVDDNGKILLVEQYARRTSAISWYNGAICPGFVNTHCHLELSHLKNAIPEKTGLLPFIKNVVTLRNTVSANEIKKAITTAAKEMYQKGIVAVGDISNTTASFFEKEKGVLRYHTFVEAFDLHPKQTKQAMKNAIDAFRKVPKTLRSTASITPHAPYTCTPQLYALIDRFAAEHCNILSIHNQESKHENFLFENELDGWPQLYNNWNIEQRGFKPKDNTALPAMSKYLSSFNQIIYVHNIFTNKRDIEWAENHFQRVFWCTNPNANLYIENTLPDYDMFRSANVKITIGTDSLASNHQLDIFEELKTIKAHYTAISTAELLQWATLNGAQALRFDNELGSLEIGKTPGLVCIDDVSPNGEITEQSAARRIY